MCERDAVPVVGVPDPDSALGQRVRRGLRVDALDVEQERRDAAVEVGAVELDSVREVLDQLPAERALVVAQDCKPAERVEVGDRRPEAGEQLVRGVPVSNRRPSGSFEDGLALYGR